LSNTNYFTFFKLTTICSLDAEYERRAAEKAKKKEREFARKLKDLRKRTRINLLKNADSADNLAMKNASITGAKHEHVFAHETEGGPQRCSICGIEVEVDEF
jgi:DNA-repair protein complementing XP-A cells